MGPPSLRARCLLNFKVDPNTTTSWPLPWSPQDPCSATCTRWPVAHPPAEQTFTVPTLPSSLTLRGPFLLCRHQPPV